MHPIGDEALVQGSSTLSLPSDLLYYTHTHTPFFLFRQIYSATHTLCLSFFFFFLPSDLL